MGSVVLDSRDYVVTFCVGSSLICCLLTFLYLGVGFRLAGRPSSVPYEFLPFVMLALGLASLGSVAIDDAMELDEWWERMLASAGTAVVAGLALSMAYRSHGLDARFWKMGKPWHVHVAAIAVYFVVGIVIHGMQEVTVF